MRDCRFQMLQRGIRSALTEIQKGVRPMQPEQVYSEIDLMAVESEARRLRAQWLRSLFAGHRAR